MKEIYLGRQPILDKNLNIFGYELFFRDKETNYAVIKDSIEATARVIMNIMSYMDFKDIISNKRGFINVTPEFIEGDLIELLPENKIVLEIGKIKRINKFIIDSIKNVKKKGYEVALDDIKMSDFLTPLFEIVDYVKLNIKEYSDIELKEAVEFLKKYPIKLIAVKVETEKDFLLAKELGFEYFQGFFFERPSLIKNKQISSYKIALMKLLKMAILEQDISEIEEFIKGYPDLAYKLLRFINSPFFYLRHKIHSIKQALSILGYSNIQKWVILQLYASEGGDIKFNPLLERAVIRGKMMEILVSRISSDIAFIDKAYITGMLSLIHVVLNKPMEEIVEELYIENDIKHALTKHEGILGYLLKAIENIEKDNLNEAIEYFHRTGLAMEDLLSAELEAITYYENFMENQ
ncbi:HDOD domain-containing protein [Persephonella sp. IF05-L8]|uniref:HDOD domain-containing protein n=1 Tax=Persephonella sp. IF05-L8 TaxID=1158338 RepID=UPI000498388C